jgi:SpoVK/Ycf46/Vps4 family AAA+-type ATPase
MPLTIQTVVPDEASRSDILRIYLKKENISDGFEIAQIAAETDGFTGAELKELCRLVSLARLKAAVTQTSINGTASSDSISLDQSVLLRPLTNADFDAALIKMKKSGRLHVN